MICCHQQSICSILIFWTVFTTNSCEKVPWGSPCSTDLQCQGGHSVYTRVFNSANCIDSRCKCDPLIQLIEFKDNNYRCSSILYGNSVHTCNNDDPDTCENGVCEDNVFSNRCQCNDGFVNAGHKCRETVTVDFSANCVTPKSGPIPVCKYDMLMWCNSTGKCGCFKDLFYDVENKTCKSKEAYVEKYSEETKAGLDEFCGISSGGLPKVCDETANMACVSKNCKCTKEFYPKFANSSGENNTCESKASYVKENNLTSYKVMPGLYCYNNDDCITGLTCASNECDCPHPCTYDNMTIACDCGAVSSMEGASQALLVGVIGGIAIIVFWGYMIKNTIDKKTTHKSHDEPVSYCNSTVSTEHHTSVPLSEPYKIKSTTTSDYSTLTPVPNPPYPVSPVSNQEPSPVPTYPVSAPSDPSAPVGFSDPIAPPNAAQQPPPYTSNLSPYSTSPAPPPYTSNPTPYHTSPATDPGNSISPAMNTGPGYNPSANATAYPLNPPTSPAADIYKPIIS